MRNEHLRWMFLHWRRWHLKSSFYAEKLDWTFWTNRAYVWTVNLELFTEFIALIQRNNEAQCEKELQHQNKFIWLEISRRNFTSCKGWQFYVFIWIFIAFQFNFQIFYSIEHFSHLIEDWSIPSHKLTSLKLEMCIFKRFHIIYFNSIVGKIEFSLIPFDSKSFNLKCNLLTQFSTATRATFIDIEIYFMMMENEVIRIVKFLLT